MGTEVKESKYWEENEAQRCRLCEMEVETWEHVWKRYRKWEEGGEIIRGRRIGGYWGRRGRENDG